MSLTHGQVKKIIAKYAGRAGKNCSSEEVNLFAQEVYQQLLYQGSYGNIRKFCFYTSCGYITLPYELEVPLKIKIENSVGTVFNKWFEFYNYGDSTGYRECGNSIQEDPNNFPTIFDIPTSGTKVAVKATANEAEDAHVIIKGFDTTGREVYTTHNGVKVVGEYLRIKKGFTIVSNVTFGKITNVVKTKTNGYVNFIAVSSDGTKTSFLADYSPLEEIPSYRRFYITGGAKGNIKVNIIGRIRLRESYADDDVVPFDNIHAIRLAAQSINSETNNDVNTAIAKEQKLERVLDRERQYKRVTVSQPVEVFTPTSPSSLIGALGRGLRRRWR
jgi:hypothetical protein